MADILYTVIPNSTNIRAIQKWIQDSDGSYYPYTPISLTAPGGTTFGDASAANQTAVQADAGSSASKALAVQGIVGALPIAITGSVTIVGGGGGGGSTDVSALALETGGNLAGIFGKLPVSLGPKTSSASFSVTLPSDQAAIPTTQSGVWSTGRTWTLASGTDTVRIGSTLPAFAAIPTFAIDQTTAGTTNKVSIGTDGQVAATQSGAWSVGITGTPAVVQSGIWNINNVAGTISLPTGAATAALQTAGNSSLTTIATNTGNIPAGLTITTNRLLVDGSGVTQPVSITTLPAFAAIPTFTINQASPGTTNKVFIGNDGEVAATQSGVWSIAGTVSLPTGAATSALQTTGNTALDTIATNTGNIPVGLTVASTRLLVDGSGVTQPVSLATNTSISFGTGAVDAKTQRVTLDSGQLSFLQPLSTVSLSGTLPAFGSTPTFNIGTAPTIAVTGAFFQATQPVSLASLPVLSTGANVIGSIANTGFTATQSGSWSVKVTDGLNNASILNLTGSNALAIALVDGTGAQVSSFGGGTQYLNDQAVLSPTGTVSLGHDGTNVRALSTNSEGHLKIVDDDNMAMLNRIVTSLLSLTNVDALQRQLITLDSITAGVTLPTVTSVTTVGTITNPVDTTVGASGAGLGYELYTLAMRSAYNTALL